MRFRGRGLAGAFGAFTLVLGAFVAAVAHPAQPTSRQGVVAYTYEYSTSKGGRHWNLHMQGVDGYWKLRDPSSYQPPIDSTAALAGQRIEFAVNGSSADVIELTTIRDDVSHTTDLYRDPSIELNEGHIEGAGLALAGLLALVIAVIPRRRSD